MSKPALQRASLSKLKTTQAKAVSVPTPDMVEESLLPTGNLLPLVISPRVKSLSLASWTAHNLDFIESRLFKHGGILFRGFDVHSLETFEEYLKSTSVELSSYMESATPRTLLREKIYTSTEYPAHQRIALHNELSTSTVFPMKIWFLCLEPAASGGETPIADVRKVYQRIDLMIRKRFIEKGWMLVRNYGEGFSLPWQESFHTSDKRVFEDYCRQNDIQFEWRADDQLRTRQVRSAVSQHPTTRELVWFNHVAFWHISSLESQVREGMLAAFHEEELPYNTYYGDGSRIDDSVAAALREAYDRETQMFSWQGGDLLMLDNVLVAHGRSPYTGSRRVMAAMGQPNSKRD